MGVLRLEEFPSRIFHDSVVLCAVSQDNLLDASGLRPVACLPVFPAHAMADTTSILLNDYSHRKCYIFIVFFIVQDINLFVCTAAL